MRGNRLSGGSTGGYTMTPEQIETFRRAVRGVSSRTDDRLTSAFDVTSHLAETPTGHQGVITVAAPTGRLRFNIDPTKDMFEGEDEPLAGDTGEELSADITAAIASTLLQQTNIGSAPAQ